MRIIKSPAPYHYTNANEGLELSDLFIRACENVKTVFWEIEKAADAKI